MRYVLIVGAMFFVACMPSVRAEDVVKLKAIEDTDCGSLDIDRGPEGIYVARGCGKIVAYACERPAAVGPGYSVAEGTGCKKVDVPSSVR